MFFDELGSRNLRSVSLSSMVSEAIRVRRRETQIAPQTLRLDVKVNRQARMHKDRFDRGGLGIHNRPGITRRNQNIAIRGVPEPIRRQPVVVGTEIFRLYKRRHVPDEMHLDASHTHKSDRRIP